MGTWGPSVHPGPSLSNCQSLLRGGCDWAREAAWSTRPLHLLLTPSPPQAGAPPPHPVLTPSGSTPPLVRPFSFVNRSCYPPLGSHPGWPMSTSSSFPPSQDSSRRRTPSGSPAPLPVPGALVGPEPVPPKAGRPCPCRVPTPPFPGEHRGSLIGCGMVVKRQQTGKGRWL